MFDLFRLEWLVAPRYARWVRRGAIVGAGLGVVAYAALFWYFEAGPGRANPDRGDVHGFFIILLGFPFSLLAGYGASLGAVIGHILLAASVALAWGLWGGVLFGIGALVYYRVRPA